MSGNIPIYSANVNRPVGFTQESNIKDFSKNYILWGIDGNFVFRVIENGTLFATTDHCGCIEIRDSNVIPEYLLYALYSVKDKYGFDRTLRASLQNMRTIEVNVPIDNNGAFDVVTQERIAKGYTLIEEIKSKALSDIRRISGIKLTIPQETRVKNERLVDLFDIHLGNAKYNRRYFNSHKGSYPVYSGQTKNSGEIAKIDTYDYDTEGLTWTIDGYAGRVFYRKGKFSLTTHCGLLVIKKQYLSKLSYEFLAYLLDNILPSYAVGEGNRRLKKAHISKINIDIPIDDNGEYDFQQQQNIAKVYKTTDSIKENIIRQLNRVIETNILVSS